MLHLWPDTPHLPTRTVVSLRNSPSPHPSVSALPRMAWYVLSGYLEGHTPLKLPTTVRHPKGIRYFVYKSGPLVHTLIGVVLTEDTHEIDRHQVLVIRDQISDMSQPFRELKCVFLLLQVLELRTLRSVCRYAYKIVIFVVITTFNNFSGTKVVTFVTVTFKYTYTHVWLCPGCSMPEPCRSHDWALVPANPASKAEY